MLTTDGAVFVFSSFNFFAEFLGFETNVISIHHGVTFHAPVVSSPGHDFELNFILMHCGRSKGCKVGGLKKKSAFRPRPHSNRAARVRDHPGSNHS